MKSTGITRNIDEVGRLVIPREIRKTLKLEQGTPMEILVDDNNYLILKKISPVFNLTEQAKKIAKLIYDIFDITILITDLDKVLACCGKDKKDFQNKILHSKFIEIISKRKNGYFTKNDSIYIVDNESKYSNFALAPIIIESNCYGSVALFNSNTFLYNEKLLNKIANFISECINL